MTTSSPSGASSYAPSERPARRRLSPKEREQQIVQMAVEFFAENGFEASTRDLAKVLGVTQPLLYRYFPNKEAIIGRVYEEVFVRRWNPEWEKWLADSSVPLEHRLKRYFKDYARFVMRGEWVRIFMYAGLSRGGINRKYLARLRERHFMVIAQELRREYHIPEPADADAEEDELELIWATHASIFYVGVRKWIYELSTPKNLDRIIDMRVDAFLAGAPPILLRSRTLRKT